MTLSFSFPSLSLPYPQLSKAPHYSNVSHSKSTPITKLISLFLPSTSHLKTSSQYPQAHFSKQKSRCLVPHQVFYVISQAISSPAQAACLMRFTDRAFFSHSQGQVELM
jgi:hypothetical protein